MTAKPSTGDRAALPRPGLYLGLQSLSLVLLVAGFAGPWVYGPLGKSAEWGWQPVWGLLLSLVAVNIFGLAAFASCLSYVEMVYRLGRPPLAGLLKWIGGFVALVVLTPLAVWTLFNLPERDPRPLRPEGSPGWGLWLALAGLLLELLALRLRIRWLKLAAGSQASESEAYRGSPDESEAYRGSPDA